jgi:hypothetical protein
MKRILLVTQVVLCCVPPAACAQAQTTANSKGLASATSATSKSLTKIDLAKWKLHFDGVAVRSDLPAYFPVDDGGASPAVIEVATEARAPASVAYLALVEHKNDPSAAFVGGVVNGPAGPLISVGIEVTNSDQKPATFFVGDVALVSPSGQRLRFVAVSKGDSPLIAKFSDRAEKASEAVPVIVDAGKTVRLNYCLVLVPNSFPLRLQFGTAKTDISVNDLQALPARKVGDEGSSVSLGGVISLHDDFPSQKLDGPVLRFESIPFSKGDRLAASGGRTMDTLSDLKDYKGISGPEVPLLEMSRGHSYIAGRMFVLQPITPVKATVTVQGREVAFTSSVRAQAGDVLGGSFSNLDNDNNCALSQYVVIQQARN